MPADDTPAASEAIDCITAVQRLWDYLDGELDTARWMEVEAHLAACLPCTSHFAFAQQLLERIEAARANHEELDALNGRVRAALRAEGFTSQPG